MCTYAQTAYELRVLKYIFIMFVLTSKQHMTAEYFNKISIIFVLVRKQRMNAEYFDKFSTIIVLTGIQRMRVGYSTIY